MTLGNRKTTLIRSLLLSMSVSLTAALSAQAAPTFTTVAEDLPVRPTETSIPDRARVPTWTVKARHGLVVREGPDATARRMGKLKNGARFSPACKRIGRSAVSGTVRQTQVWLQLAPRRYVSASYVWSTTGSLDKVPICDELILVGDQGGNRVAVPTFMTKKFTGLAIAGHPGYKRSYYWSVASMSEGQACVKVKGFRFPDNRDDRWSAGKEYWVSAGCGKSGGAEVEWGNVLAYTEVEIKSTIPMLGVAINWFD